MAPALLWQVLFRCQVVPKTLVSRFEIPLNFSACFFPCGRLYSARPPEPNVREGPEKAHDSEQLYLWFQHLGFWARQPAVPAVPVRCHYAGALVIRRVPIRMVDRCLDDLRPLHVFSASVGDPSIGSVCAAELA